jgi:hypothetical protein
LIRRPPATLTAWQRLSYKGHYSDYIWVGCQDLILRNQGFPDSTRHYCNDLREIGLTKSGKIQIFHWLTKINQNRLLNQKY